MTRDFPPQKAVEDKFLDMLLAQTGPVQMTVIYRGLADQFGLTRYERRGLRGDPKGSAWEYLVRQARKNLMHKGWVYCPETGHWALSEAGRQEARNREERDTAGRTADATAL